MKICAKASLNDKMLELYKDSNVEPEKRWCNTNIWIDVEISLQNSNYSAKNPPQDIPSSTVLIYKILNCFESCGTTFNFVTRISRRTATGVVYESNKVTSIGSAP